SRLLEGIGTAYMNEPTAAEDATQLPEVQGKTGAEALNGAFKYGGDAGKYSAQVTDALTGTETGDLARLVSGAGRTFGAFASRREDLQGLIDNFNVFTGALATQSANLSTTVNLFAPTLQVANNSLVALNRTLPPLRTYAIVLEPAVAELPGLISASKPWLAQVRPLLSGKEAGGVAKLLAESTPGLAGAAQAGLSSALPQLNRLSLCTTKVMVPTANQTINDQFSTGGPNYREFLYTLTNFAGAAQNFDGNGPYVRAQAGGGNLVIQETDPLGDLKIDRVRAASAVTPPLGVQPKAQTAPPFKPDVRCDTNPVPDLNGPQGQPGPPSAVVTSE
ncbi:MAG: hypothetical protein AB7T48_10645, partial [Solirubrobacterales bacterium]